MSARLMKKTAAVAALCLLALARHGPPRPRRERGLPGRFRPSVHGHRPFAGHAGRGHLGRPAAPRPGPARHVSRHDAARRAGRHGGLDAYPGWKRASPPRWRCVGLAIALALALPNWLGMGIGGHVRVGAWQCAWPGIAGRLGRLRLHAGLGHLAVCGTFHRSGAGRARAAAGRRGLDGRRRGVDGSLLRRRGGVPTARWAPLFQDASPGGPHTRRRWRPCRRPCRPSKCRWSTTPSTLFG